jgi:hypothetical protein
MALVYWVQPDLDAATMVLEFANVELRSKERKPKSENMNKLETYHPNINPTQKFDGAVSSGIVALSLSLSTCLVSARGTEIRGKKSNGAKQRLDL